MPKHPHAELMMQYAQDAMETDRPWERWEWRNSESPMAYWRPVGDDQPSWCPMLEYRRKPVKPKMVSITLPSGTFEYPEPHRGEVKVGQVIYMVDIYSPSLFHYSVWQERGFQVLALGRGLIHLTKEAAIAHATTIILAGGGAS